MNDSEQTTNGSMTDDVTLDMRVADLGGAEPSRADLSSGRDVYRPFELVEGSGPEMTRETQQLLKCRLRLAALVMCFGFAIFLARNLIWPAAQPDKGWFLGLHALVTAVLGFEGFSLCRRCAISTWRLRVKEMAVFGMPSIFFLLLQNMEMRNCAAYGFLPSPEGFWFLMMFTYAFLIPNRWQRAAWVIGGMATAPILLTIWLFWTEAACREAINGGVTYISHQALSLLVGAVVAVVGVRTLRQLRSEVFEARQLGQYHLRKLIGRGGMGDVYLAEHQMMRRPCAIKVIQPDRAGDPRSLARFEREVRSIAKLSHWNNVDVFDYGRTADGTFYYVMEYLPGLSIQELVARYGPLSASRAIYLLRQLCDALAEAHGQGLIHRDIKPANIFAAERGGLFDVAKLLDFGLAKPLLAASDEASREIEASMEGVISGSPLYMSPEQALGDTEPDVRSDIYSLGGVAYYMVTGRPPFQGEKALKVILAHANQRLVPPGRHAAGLPSDFELVIERCLAKRPEDRYQSIEELAEALETCQDADGWTRQDARLWWLSKDSPLLEQPVAAAV